MLKFIMSNFFKLYLPEYTTTWVRMIKYAHEKHDKAKIDDFLSVANNNINMASFLLQNIDNYEVLKENPYIVAWVDLQINLNKRVNYEAFKMFTNLYEKIHVPERWEKNEI